jgi:hypothetical protein
MGTSATLAAFRAANPVLLQLFFVVAVLSAYVYPLSYICLGRLAMPRSPWLATIGIACGFLGSVVWSLLIGESFWLAAAAQRQVGVPFLLVGKTYVANWAVLLMHGGWVIGHLLGYVLLGIALLRTQGIPQWAAWLLIVSPLVMGPLAYGTGLGLLQVLGYLLVFVGSIPAALVTLQHSNRQQHALVPTAEDLTSTS